MRRRIGRSQSKARAALESYLSGLPEHDHDEKLARAMERFCSRQGITEGTARNYRATFKKLIEFVGDASVGEVGMDEVRDFVELRRNEGRLASTIHADLRKIRALFRWLGIESIPSPKRLGIATPKGRLDFLSIPELRQLLSWIERQDDEEKCLLAGYLFTGGRATEVLSLERGDIDIDGGWVVFRLGLKAGEPRRLPIAPELARIWSEYVPQVRGRIFPNYTYERAYALWKRACRGAGIRVLTLHHARHTCASLWVMSGIDLVTVKNWLGHSSINQTMVYAKVSPAHGQDAMTRFGDWVMKKLA